MDTSVHIEFKIPQDKYKEYIKITDSYLKELDTLGEKVSVSINVTELPAECIGEK